MVNNQTNNKMIDVTSNQVTVSMIVDGFLPYQNYTATVSATTVVGYGPSATTKGRTDPDSKYVSFTVNLYIFFSSTL